MVSQDLRHHMKLVCLRGLQERNDVGIRGVRGVRAARGVTVIEAVDSQDAVLMTTVSLMPPVTVSMTLMMHRVLVQRK